MADRDEVLVPLSIKIGLEAFTIVTNTVVMHEFLASFLDRFPQATLFAACNLAQTSDSS